MSELSKRVAVAAVGIPIVLGLVYLGGWFLAVPLAVFAALAVHEVARFAREKAIRPMEWIAAPAVAALVLLAAWQGTFQGFAPHALSVVALTAFAALVAGLRWRGPEGAPLPSAAVTVLAVVYVGLALSFAPLLHALPARAGWAPLSAVGAAAGLAAVALPLAVTWIGDAAAYFAGSAWGRRKLAPSLSPNKSWEGFWAEVVAGAVAAVGWILVVRALGMAAPSAGIAVFALVGALIAVSAVVGDLVESLLKREAGVKDSGTLFPGHGGVMDRIDSLLFTIPSAYLALVLLGGGP